MRYLGVVVVRLKWRCYCADSVGMWFTILMCVLIGGFLWLVLTRLAREEKKQNDREKFIDKLMQDEQP